MKLQGLLLLVLFSNSAMAQQRLENWMKLSAGKQISRHITVAADVQFRTQADYPSQELNPFEKAKTYSIRSWLNWRTQKGTEFLFSPIAYFVSKDFNISLHDWQIMEETRQAAGLQHNFKIRQSGLRLRWLMESRNFIHGQQICRSRIQVQYQRTLFKKNQTEVGVLMSEEYFYQLFHYRMDNNRMFSGITIQSSHTQFQTGLQWQSLGTISNNVQIFQLSSTLNYKF